MRTTICFLFLTLKNIKLNFFKKTIKLIILFIFTAVSGCIQNPRIYDNQACLTHTTFPEYLAHCGATYDVNYSYKNGPRPINGTRYETAANEKVSSFYVKQKGDNMCYAAALETAFSMLGKRYKQEQFAQAISNECFGTKDFPISFSQIIFAATYVHTDGGVWYIDLPDQSLSKKMNILARLLNNRPQVLNSQNTETNQVLAYALKCQSNQGSSYYVNFNIDRPLLYFLYYRNHRLSNPLISNASLNISLSLDSYLSAIDLYHPISWHYAWHPENKIDGGIIPIKDSSQLINIFIDKSKPPILAGLAGGSNGHVVVISKIRLAVNVSLDDLKTLTPHDSSHIEWVEFADPESHTPYIKMSGDEFFKNARFIFAILQDI